MSKRNIIITAIMLLFAMTLHALNEPMYKIKSNSVVGKNNVNTQVDSIHSYQPQSQTGQTVTDADGNRYQTVTIGKQVWMSENLKTTKYNDGTAIPLVTDNTEWGKATPGYCWYNNDQATYGNTYGAIYNWHTVRTGKLCPVGWHVPTDKEWTILTTYLGGESIAGGKLKETGFNHWFSPNTGASNEAGFTALPGGNRHFNGSFNYIGNFGYWWSGPEGTNDLAWYRYIGYNFSSAGRYNYGNELGFSVRCVKD
jgi:uncharacterized protein (TIGR02145 family)